MENASEAIKMAAAALIFVIALAVSILMFSRARAASTSIIDNSGIQSYYDSSDLQNFKIVGIETVIPTLYSYFNENVTVLFYEANLTENENGRLSLSDLKPLPLYITEALNSDLKKSNLRSSLVKNTYFERAIYGFDNNDEMTRKEPWTGSEKANEDFINDFVSANNDGTKYFSSVLKLGNNRYGFVGAEPYYQLNFKNTNGGTTTLTSKLKADSLSKATGARFVERVGRYNYDAKYSDDMTYTMTNTTKSLIEFDNGESIENTSGNIKRVIQFIYIGDNGE